jgi:hypothetical protein
MAREAWATPVLPRARITSVNKLRETYPRGKYYWLLLTSGFRTYRFLPVFWREFYPRFNARHLILLQLLSELHLISLQFAYSLLFLFSMLFHSRLIAAFLAIGCVCAQASDMPWVMLAPAHDTRAADMQAWDDADSRNLVNVINASQEYAHCHFQWSKTSILKLLDRNIPFAELRFDPVKPMEFTPDEKSTLQEWLKRGGFLLVFEDAYPYEQEEFRKAHDLPVFDFFTRELPAANTAFTIEKATDAHPIFSAHYTTETVPSIRREMRENPFYRGRTMVLYRGRVVAFFMGRYNYEENNRWVPMSRPFSETFSYDIRSYYLILNIYIYATMH